MSSMRDKIEGSKEVVYARTNKVLDEAIKLLIKGLKEDIKKETWDLLEYCGVTVKKESEESGK